MKSFVCGDIKKLLEFGFPEDVDSPIYTKNGQQMMRFDEIRISNMEDHVGGLKIEFRWNGRATHWIREEWAKLEDGKQVVIYGINGEQGFSLEFA